ncbi:P44/Msp2 family outer membrane protein [Anaplasma phagocytophilum]
MTKYHVYFIGMYYEINQEKSLGVVPYTCVGLGGNLEGVVDEHITPKLAYRLKVDLSYQLSPEISAFAGVPTITFTRDMMTTVCTCLFGTINSFYSVDFLVVPNVSILLINNMVQTTASIQYFSAI